AARRLSARNATLNGKHHLLSPYPQRRREYCATNIEGLPRLAEDQFCFLCPSPVRIQNVWGRHNSCQAVRALRKTEYRRLRNLPPPGECKKSRRSTSERLAERAAKSLSCQRPKPQRI